MQRSERTPIVAHSSYKIVGIAAAGVVTAGTALFTAEAMKMQITHNSPTYGFFEATVAAGVTLIAGEIIGYFTTTPPE